MQNLYTSSPIISRDQFQKIEDALRKSWSRATCFPQDQRMWSKKNPAFGQCAVTALVIHDLFGGTFANDKAHNHIWNILPDGTEQDFSREQIKGDSSLSITRTLNRNDVESDDGARKVGTPMRYKLLREAFQSNYP